ncbi:uncharacterized protein SCHCODRAFT_02486841, partial [Schizophyllum commune H4-8]|uniref:uncharacterized protein n=1 Tax=Schizophyllum commune (strain H4-8 / FGSC 9210) TaxID=578458 RepID=UPI00215DF26E
MRSEGHNNLPNFVGGPLPRNDDPDQYDFYCASMLTLLKPWRDIRQLKGEAQTWKEAFAEFCDTATAKQRRFLAGAQYFHECQ